VNFGAGPVTFAVGDWVLYGSGTWQKSNGQNGTVTSVAVTESGDALTITGSPITTAGTINIGFAGTSGQYVNGAGGLTTFPSLTGFVPYTGATANVDLGGNSLYLNNGQAIFGRNFTGTTAYALIGVNPSNKVSIDTSALGAVFGGDVTSISYIANGLGSQGGTIALKQNGLMSASTGYTTLGSLSAGQLVIYFGDSNLYAATFLNTSLTDSRSYTLPNLSGTLALLEGTQTFSGAKTFSLGISAVGGISFPETVGGSNYGGITGSSSFLQISAQNGSAILFKSSNNTNAITISTVGKVDFGSTIGNGTYTYTLPSATGTLALTSELSAYLPLAGGTLTGGLIGTTASFSGTVSSIVTSGGTSFRVVNSVNSRAWSLVPSTNGAESDLWLYYGGTGTGTKVSFVNNGNVLIGSTTDSGELLQVNGTSKFTGALSGTTGSFASSGGSDTFAINHSSGSGIALNITKGGNGEGLYINKTSGSGNAATIIGTLNATTLVKSGGTSSQFLMADGSVNTSVLPSGAYLPLTGGMLTGALSGTSATFSGGVIVTGSNPSYRTDNTTSYTSLVSYLSGTRSWQIDNVSNNFQLYMAGSLNTYAFNIAASTGAATFSSSVTASGGASGVGFIMTNTTNSRQVTIGYTSGEAYNYIQAYDGTNFQRLVLNGSLSLAGSGAATFSSTVWALGAGSVTNPTFAVRNDDCGLYSPAINTLGFTVNSGEAGRISSSRNWLIGTTTDAGYKLDVNGTGRFSSQLSIGAGTQAINGDAELTLREGVAFVGLDFQSARTSGNLGGLRFFNTSSTTDAIAQLLIEVDGKFAFYNNNNATPRFTIASTGAATFSNLAGTGSRAVLADANGLLSAPVSDISVKQNITSIGYGLNEILKMNPVWFDFIDEYKNYGEGRQNGMIAQEVAEVIPEAVFTTPSTGKMGINYDQLHAVYIKAIQELKAEIEQLKNK
jgi:hypothetical protein